jgi:hypothetical protein
MMDDVVGLVMVQVISNLGGDNFSWATVVRPILVSVAFAAVTPLICIFVVKPMTLWFNQPQESRPSTRFTNLIRKTSTVFVVHTLILIGLVTGATYAGTSNLFAAYIAGASISWWDSEVPHSITKATPPQVVTGEKHGKVVSAPAIAQPPLRESSSNSQEVQDMSSESRTEHNATVETSDAVDDDSHSEDTSGSAIYNHYYHAAVSRILQPLFFASVGFSIPITKMFKGAIVWRGIVYTVLMALGKLVCGLWLVRFSKSTVPSKGKASRLLSKLRLPPHLWGSRSDTSAPAGAPNATRATTDVTSSVSPSHRSSPNPPKPVSLHPPLMLAFAMCARGEIGFLISGVAESNGVFSGSGETSNGPSDIFLVVTWAIVLCTIAGPLGVGLSVRRVKKLEEQKNRQHGEGAERDVLGVWGVN